MNLDSITQAGAFGNAPMSILTQPELTPNHLGSDATADRFTRLDSFLAAFGFTEDTPVHIRALPPKGTADLVPVKVVTTRGQLRSSSHEQDRLIRLNETHGLYFVVNEGGDTERDITRFSAFFVESDTASISEQDRRLDEAPIQPNIRVETKKSVHAYWLIEGDCSAGDWREMQRSLIRYFDGDRAICNPSRLMRLPFFDHLSVSEEAGRVQRKPVELSTFAPSRLNTLEQMRAAFPVATEDKPATHEMNSEFDGYPRDPKRDREVAKECLRFLSKERSDEYANWLNVGIALCNIFGGDDEGLDLWRDWSQQSDKYEEGCCDEKWDTFDDPGFGRRLGVGSLILWAREDSVEYCALEENRRTERRVEIAEQRAEAEQFTDLGNARRLVRRHGENIRYDYRHKLWFAWEGARWVEDAEAAVMQLAKETVTALYKETAETQDPDKRQALSKHAVRSESAKSLRAMVELARSEPKVKADVTEFDASTHLLNVLNGTVDLRTGALLPHRREDKLTKQVPIAYDANAKAPLFESFLHRIFDGNQNLIRFMQRSGGYSLTGETGEQCMFLLHGSGANGKSTFLEILAAATADYGMQVKTEALMKHKHTSAGAASEDIAELRGARFASAVETNAGQKFAESLLKQVTGQDRVKARRLYSHNIEFRPTFKLWLACNHKPEIEGTDHGIWRRIHLIPFTVTIPEQERDNRLLDKLRAELPGIMAWFVSGAVEYYRSGIQAPEEVRQATAKYRAEQDTIADFILDQCDVGNGHTAGLGEMYGAFEQWCLANGEDRVPKKVFTEMLKERGLKQVRTSRARMWSGIAVRKTFGLSLAPAA